MGKRIGIDRNKLLKKELRGKINDLRNKRKILKISNIVGKIREDIVSVKQNKLLYRYEHAKY